MTKIELFRTSILFLFIVVSTSSLGIFFLQKISSLLKNNKGIFTNNPLLFMGIAQLVGVIIFGNIGLILGLFFRFSTQGLLIALLLCALTVFTKSVTQNLKILVEDLFNLFKELVITPIPLILTLLSVAIVGSLYLSAFQIPYSIDELAYHFPQAESIIKQHGMELTLSGGPFYGNIPKLMEIIFAIGISLKGYALAHLLNFLIFVSFLLTIFGFIRKNFSLGSAALTTLLICLYDDFTWNATTGYIDSATSIIEISAILIVCLWLISTKKKNGALLVIGGVLVGSSLALKYSALPTAFFTTLLVAYGTFTSRTGKKIFPIIYYTLPAFLFGAYWYIKNLLVFKNPFYPLYFGHQGVSEVEYTSLINAIQQFQPKTVSTFFKLIGFYKTVNGMPVYLSFFLFPIALINNKKNRLIIYILAFYAIFYTIYWFFFATHQIRFLTDSILVFIILTGVGIGFISKKIIISVSIASLIFFMFTPYVPKNAWRDFWYTKLNVVRRQYALGNESEKRMYERYFGCKYDIMTYLKNIGYEGRVIDNWTTWLDRPWPLLPERDKFMSYEVDASNKKRFVQNILIDKIDYMYINDKIKQKHFINTNPLITQDRDRKLPGEKFLLSYSKVIYISGDCKLYKINTDKLSLFLR